MKTRSLYGFLLFAALSCLRAAVAAPAPAASAPVVVTLAAEKRISPTDKDAQPTWQGLTQKGTVVLPGDVLRYTVTGISHLSRPIRGFMLSQPIPRGTEYLAQSAALLSGDARMTASIDGGKTYAEHPTVRVTHPDGTTTDEPAPASLYTHIRWTFVGDLPALASVSARCEVRVR